MSPTETAALFPGQGSQTADMRDLVAERAPELLERCVALVGEDPFPRVEENTRYAQPAIFCASLAGWDALDLTALAAAGALSRDDALELVVLRGRLMGEAPNGSMLALVGGSIEDAEEIAAEAGVTVANDNAPGQVVLSGDRDALEHATRVAAERGRRSLPLKVAGAFHSPAMEPAVAPFRAALEEVEVSEPRFPVFSCASAAPFADVRAELAATLIRPVRWRETVLALHEAGARAFAEVGPGDVLTKMNKRILKGLAAHA